MKPPKDALTARDVARHCLLGGPTTKTGLTDIDKPVIIKLGLFDNRVAYLRCHSSSDGHAVFTLCQTPYVEQRSMTEHDIVRRQLGKTPEPLDDGYPHPTERAMFEQLRQGVSLADQVTLDDMGIGRPAP